MQVTNLDNSFRNLTYYKTAAEIKEAALSKIDKLNAKIENRLKRVTGLRKEYGIDDAALVQLLQAARKQQNASMSYTYSTSNAAVGGGSKMEERTIGAGVVNNLMTENDFIESEKDQVEALSLIVRNLKPILKHSANGQELPDGGFVLNTDELRYLGF
jgi:hypothetical protein